jgi:S-adenosylmethionine:tRNA-ribosyltransferase-isomerase (queuine synthetase)
MPVGTNATVKGLTVDDLKSTGSEIILGNTYHLMLRPGDETIRGYSGFTKLFIYPGYKFKAVDRLITNFHLPQSSLLMLVSAFIGYDKMKEIYKIAVEKEYRFLSYGDAMLLEKDEI